MDRLPNYLGLYIKGMYYVQLMEDGQVEVVRVSGHIRYPASFSLIAATNPCPCGWLGHPRKECKCTPKEIARYRRRISGPILDRIDLWVSVAAVEVEKLALTNPKITHKITSKQAKTQVIKARAIQSKRFTNLSIYTNSQMRNKEVKKLCFLTPEAENLLKMAVEKYDFSARSYFRLIKVARTIADLEGHKKIMPFHMAEALQYKQTI